MKYNNKLSIGITVFITALAACNIACAETKTTTFSPREWCDVTMPASVKLGDKIEIKIDYKNLDETFIGCVMTYKSTAKAGWFPCKSAPVKVKGTGTIKFTATIPLRYGMTELHASVFITPDGKWESKTDDTKPKDRKAKGKDAFAVPVIYDKILTRPADDWHKKTKTLTAKSADWCEIIVPTSAQVGKRMNATVKYKDLEATNLTCVLHYVLKTGEAGYMSSAVQGTEKVSGSGQITFWLPVLKNVESLEAVAVGVFLSKDGNWRSKTKSIVGKFITCKP